MTRGKLGRGSTIAAADLGERGERVGERVVAHGDERAHVELGVARRIEPDARVERGGGGAWRGAARGGAARGERDGGDGGDADDGDDSALLRGDDAVSSSRGRERRGAVARARTANGREEEGGRARSLFVLLRAIVVGPIKDVRGRASPHPILRGCAQGGAGNYAHAQPLQAMMGLRTQLSDAPKARYYTTRNPQP